MKQQASELREAILELTRAYQFRDRDCICSHDISVTQGHTLSFLSKWGATTLNSLAAELVIEKSTMCRVVDALERKGLVIRTPNPENRRTIFVDVTDAGRKIQEAFDGQLLEEHEQILNRIPKHQVDETLMLLRGLVAAVRSDVEATCGTCCKTC